MKVNKLNKVNIAIALTAALSMHAFSSARQTTASLPEPEAAPDYSPAVFGGSPLQERPRAIVYRTSKPCADLVPVQVSADGTALISYPAPSDLNPALSAPVELPGGWWLDRRGVGTASVFTTYTYAQYSAMKQAPSPADILAHIDPQAHITAMYALPVSAAEAAANPDICNKYIADGFRDCEKMRTFAH